ncbi:glutaredoxin family protein [Mangrovibacillus cuniculi]|uniref:Glutaredoxin family protein n=1 Tax=Mangrovibacillus cuniculi TaxID=2593652 RepID=A0A7S8HF59_9BACI|nr:glutaredoxin family protein [Mangrovibacillus cuniculi]QPC46176.1 glutaredoxin family protein [Mangrovibacillus cuniculi]
MTIIVYSQPDCPPCQLVKMYLNDRGIKFTEKNIREDQQAFKEVTEIYRASSTPVVAVNGEAVIGFDLEKLTSLLERNSK